MRFDIDRGVAPASRDTLVPPTAMGKYGLILPPNRVSPLLPIAIIYALTAFLACGAQVDQFGTAVSGMAGLLFAGSTVECCGGVMMADNLVVPIGFFARPWHLADT